MAEKRGVDVLLIEAPHLDLDESYPPEHVGCAIGLARFTGHPTLGTGHICRKCGQCLARDSKTLRRSPRNKRKRPKGNPKAPARRGMRGHGYSNPWPGCVIPSAWAEPDANICDPIGSAGDPALGTALALPAGNLTVTREADFTHQACPRCGHLGARFCLAAHHRRRGKVVFRCFACGWEGHADLSNEVLESAQELARQFSRDGDIETRAKNTGSPGPGHQLPYRPITKTGLHGQ